MTGVTMMHSVRFKVTAITICAILTAILSVFVASFSTFQAENDRRSVEVLNLIGEDVQNSLEKYTEGIQQSMDLVANLAVDSLDSVELVKGGVVGIDEAQAGRSKERTAELDAYLAEYLGRIEQAAGTVASHTHGIVGYYYCVNPEVSATEHGFFYSRVGKAGFNEQEPLDARELDPDDLEHTTWYFTAIERGRPSWVGPYTAHFLSDMQICSYLVPIYKSGTLVGVLGMDIPVETLVEQVSSLEVYETGFACLLSADGRVMYHPELDYGSTLDLPVNELILHQENSGNSLIRYEHDGEERQLSFTTLSSGMKLAVIAPTAEVNAATSQLVQIILLITAVVLVAFSVITLLVMRFLTEPLQRLTAASQRLAAADYDVELDYNSRDEVGMLTNSFQQMRDQLKANIEDLNRRVSTDDLTGLPNQRRFLELAEMEQQRMRDDGKQSVILYFNLLGTKHFNRQYGFDEGDRLLCEMADALKRHFEGQPVSRFGQDQFAVMTDEDRLEERIRDVFEECRGINGGKTLPVAVGIYQNSLEEVDASVACDRAKYACDQRKGSYISGLRYFDIGMVKEVETVRYVINHLDEALENDWIEVYYQPIVRAANGRVCDEEALSRWNDPQRGFMPPSDFIPALENAGLIYKLDLYMLDQVIEKMKRLEELGLSVVPHSLNLSRTDFESCDIVEEIRSRVDAAGIKRDRITIEITESIIGRDFDFMKGQIMRFRELGFPVWMDDFGSGYSSLDVLKSIHFDLIKFDMSFMRNLDEGENGKIILTQMMKMATALGVDTICEGVETKKQVRFLQEIGCSKLQGFYFCRPIPFSEIMKRYEEGRQIGFENPAESEYYEAIGRVNLYDLTVLASEDEGSLQNIFDMLPMGILEIRDDGAGFVRTNQSYRDFAEQYFGSEQGEEALDRSAAYLDAESSFMKLATECCQKGTRAFFDEEMPDGTVAHAFARGVGMNPVTGTMAAVVAVLSLTEPNEGATYASIARALALDYYYIYYVDLDTEQFIEYSSPVGEDELAVERHGGDFFAASKRDAMVRVHEEDRDAFVARFTKENIVRELDERGVFTVSYRLIDTGVPMAMSMKITRMGPEGRHIIIGVSIVDGPMKQA